MNDVCGDLLTSFGPKPSRRLPSPAAMYAKADLDAKGILAKVFETIGRDIADRRFAAVTGMTAQSTNQEGKASFMLWRRTFG